MLEGTWNRAGGTGWEVGGIWDRAGVQVGRDTVQVGRWGGYGGTGWEGYETGQGVHVGRDMGQGRGICWEGYGTGQGVHVGRNIGQGRGTGWEGHVGRDMDRAEGTC